MHVYPKRDPGHWRRAVRHVRARLSQFDGLRLVSVAVDQSTDRADDVCREFGGLVDVREVPNDDRQEVVSFPWLLEEASQASSPDDLVFYCHAKGCTHSANQSSHLWCDAMASTCLDYPQFVEHVLRERSIAGAFRSIQRVGASAATFHYAGTFYWFRAGVAFSRDWRNCDADFWGAESWPGLVFDIGEGGCLFYDSAETAHLYNLGWWHTAGCPAYRHWRAEFDRRGIKPLAYDPALLWPQFREWTT
jgi:hypothetical protein